MTLGDWDRIRQVFSAALNVPAAERDAYVRSACGSDEQLHRAVADLLRAHCDASKTFLEPRTIVFAAPWLFRDGDRVANRFSVVKRIARGAMGEVYQVYDERLRLQVALKAIRPELIGDAETAERFRREVLVTRDLSHEGLCRIFDLVEHVVGDDAGLPPGTVVPCLTMQLLEGESLEEWLSTRRPITATEALPLLEQIGNALQVLHDAGIVHRDLKPSNVMLISTPAGTRAVLTDFGLAKPLDESIFETQAHVQGGAPYFMAPELLKGDRPSHASDVIDAFGLLIDEMVTSTRAFSSDSLHALLLQKLGEGPALPSSRSSGLSGNWERAILRCLSPDPRQRFPSPRAALNALSAPERWAPWQRWFRPRVPSSTVRRWRLAGYAAIAAVVLTGGALLAGPVQEISPRSIVIENFANLTNKAELNYLATGTASELARRLSRMPELRVYRQLDSATPVTASQRATFSLRGDIQEIDAMVRISVQVTDTVGKVLWSQTFDGPGERALEIENQLATDAVSALVGLYPPGEDGPWRRASLLLGRVFMMPRPHPPSSGTANNAAFDAYLRGRVLFEERTLPTALQAIEYLKRSVDADPHFAAAYAMLADVQGVLMDLHYAPHSTLIAEAERYAEQAVALDPDLPEAQLSLAALRQLQWRWSDSENAYRRAIELHPTFARAHRWYGGLLLQFGRFDESLALYRRGLELDPYDYPSQSAYGHALLHAGRTSEAAEHLERLLTQKDLLYAHVILGQVYACLTGTDTVRRDEFLRKALEQSEILRTRETAGQGAPGVTEYADMVGALAWSYRGEPTSAAPFVQRLEDWRAQGRVSPSVLARVYAAQGDARRAIDALLQSEVQRDRELFYITVSPYYASIRNEPQFRALVERLHLSR